MFDTSVCTTVLEEKLDTSILAGFGLVPAGENRGNGVIVILKSRCRRRLESLKSAGATVLAPPREEEWGRKIHLIKGLDGFDLEISRPLE